MHSFVTPNYTYPQISAVDIIPTQPKAADMRCIEHLQSERDATLDPVTYIIKINFASTPPITNRGISLYLDDYHVRKYSAHKGGIYIKVNDPTFLQTHAGKVIQFSYDDVNLHDSGYRLPVESEVAALRTQNTSQDLPAQETVLK